MMNCRILDVDIARGVEGHFDHPHGREWTNMTEHVHPLLAEVVGQSSIVYLIYHSL
jgi:kynureninase